MHIEALRHYALSLPATEEGFPFDDKTLVFKVGGKMFLLAGLEHQPLRFNFKGKPEDNLRYRENYPAVSPGYHSNKIHWNTVECEGSVPDTELLQWVLDSYHLVLSSMPLYRQKEINALLSRHE